MRTRRSERSGPDWTKLLIEAVNMPGIVSSAYSRFWNYSGGNQLLAMFECLHRGLPLGPINTFKRWLDLGRYVKKGEKAISLCMPVTVKRKGAQSASAPTDGVAGDEPDAGHETVFVYKPHWFVLSQTVGAPYTPVEAPAWLETRSLHVLGIDRIEFSHPDGNCQGFARCREVAISPIAALPHKTLFHELAHVILGHTEEGMLDDHAVTATNLREVEAECVALICCESLNLPGVPECRGYIQHWLRRGSQDAVAIPHHAVQRIFRAADMILKAGQPAVPLDFNS